MRAWRLGEAAYATTELLGNFGGFALWLRRAPGLGYRSSHHRARITVLCRELFSVPTRRDRRVAGLMDTTLVRSVFNAFCASATAYAFGAIVRLAAG